MTVSEAPFEEKEINHVMTLKKWIEPDQSLEWQREEGYQKFVLSVQCEESYKLQLVGIFTEATGYYKFHLFLGSYPIRMLHVGKSHHNPDCMHVGSHHKHKWTDEYMWHWAYEPDDIDFSNIERTFWTFLEECHIEYKGRFIGPVIQRRLL